MLLIAFFAWLTLASSAVQQSTSVPFIQPTYLKYVVSSSFPNWLIQRSQNVDNINKTDLGFNPVIPVRVGDIINFQVNTTAQYPFSIYKDVNPMADYYNGFSVPVMLAGSGNVTLTVGADMSGKTLFYVCPYKMQSDHMFGVILVDAVPYSLVPTNLNPATTIHTYVIYAYPAALPKWYFASSLVGSILNGVRGYNPTIYANVGDLMVLRVWTNISYPFTVSTSKTTISVYAGFNATNATYGVLNISLDVAGTDLYYICPTRLNMVGIIRVPRQST